MKTELPKDKIDEICIGFKKRFGKDIDFRLVDFIRDLQSEVAVEEGFKKNRPVRFFNLAGFKPSPEKADAIDSRKRLARKYGDDRKKINKELKAIGKHINQEKSRKFKEKKLRNKKLKELKSTQYIGMTSTCGKYTIKS